MISNANLRNWGWNVTVNNTAPVNGNARSVGWAARVRIAPAIQTELARSVATLEIDLTSTMVLLLDLTQGLLGIPNLGMYLLTVHQIPIRTKRIRLPAQRLHLLPEVLVLVPRFILEDTLWKGNLFVLAQGPLRLYQAVGLVYRSLNPIHSLSLPDLVKMAVTQENNNSLLLLASLGLSMRHNPTRPSRR